MTGASGGSKLDRLMEGLRTSPRIRTRTVLLALLLTLPSAPFLACDLTHSDIVRIAGEGKQPENRPARERCKRADNPHATAPKGCSDGGERLPQDRHSPLDDAPPLSPLVA